MSCHALIGVWSVPLISVILLRNHMADHWSGEASQRRPESERKNVKTKTKNPCRRGDLNRRPLECQAMMVTTIPRCSPWGYNLTSSQSVSFVISQIDVGIAT